MNQKLSELQKRVEAVEAKRGSPIISESDINYRAIQCLTYEERDTLCDVIKAAEKEHANPEEDEIWLSNRPQQEQAVVKKVLARFKELQQEAKSK